MDVCGIFLGDSSLSYGTMRNSIYRDYEKFPYGTLENIPNSAIKDHYSKAQEKCQQSKKDKKGDECPFCKEHKKRPLISYLRRRELQKNNEKICEEEEELGEPGTSTSSCTSNTNGNQQHSDKKYCENERRQNCTKEEHQNTDDDEISD